MPIANGLLKPANIPISNRRIGDRGCTGNYRCGETRAGRHFPRAQGRGNASQENKVPRSDRSALSLIARSSPSAPFAFVARISRLAVRIQPAPASSFAWPVFPLPAGTTSSIIHTCATSATIDFPVRRSFAPADSASRAHSLATHRNRIVPIRRRPESAGSEVAHRVAPVLATVRRSNVVCGFPAPRFHEGALF
jgi:hypothetical protein